MERSRSGLFSVLFPALLLVLAAGLAILVVSRGWFQAEAQSSARRRLADAAAAVEKQLDGAVGRQAEATRALGTSPMVWLWVKFQGELLTPSNLFHAQAALAEVTNYASLVPGVTVYLASERTRTVYRDGAAVAALSRGDPRDAWYADSLGTEGVLTAEDPRLVRTSMRVMNGRTLLGALSCVSDVSTLAGGVLGDAAERTGFSFVLTDRAGTPLAAHGSGAAAGAGSAATVFDLFSPAARAGITGAMAAAARPGAMTVAQYPARGGQVLAAVTRTGAPGWYLFALTAAPRVQAGRAIALGAIAAAAMAVLLAALLLVGRARDRRSETLIGLLQEERDAANAIAHDIGAAALRLRSVAGTLRERAAVLASEAASAATSGNEAAGLLAQAEDRSAELRSGFAARLPLLTALASSARDAAAKSREARSAAETAAARAAEAEVDLNRVITAGSAVCLAVENAVKEVDGVVQAAERTRLLALNAALEASRSAGRGGARMADDMRRVAEEAGAHAQALAAALEEARSNARVVSRSAQEAGAAVHTASTRASDSSRALNSAWEGVDGVLSKVEAAGISAGRLRDDAGVSDRGRSAVAGVARVMTRIEELCTEIAEIAASVSTESAHAAQKASGHDAIAPQDRQVS